jgi:hypothetical protein
VITLIALAFTRETKGVDLASVDAADAEKHGLARAGSAAG